GHQPRDQRTDRHSKLLLSWVQPRARPHGRPWVLASPETASRCVPERNRRPAIPVTRKGRRDSNPVTLRAPERGARVSGWESAAGDGDEEVLTHGTTQHHRVSPELECHGSVGITSPDNGRGARRKPVLVKQFKRRPVEFDGFADPFEPDGAGRCHI